MPRSVHILLLMMVLWVSTLHSAAQVTYPERLSVEQAEDTAAIARLIRESRKQYNNADSAIALLQQAYTLSKNTGYIDGCARALLGLGTNMFNKGELEKSKVYFREAYPYCNHALFARRQLMVQWCNNMASPFSMQGMSDSAAYYYYKALDVMGTPGIADSDLYTVILANLGTVWQKAGQNKKSLYYSQKGLQIALIRNDSDRIADIYESIGLATMGNDSSSRNWLRKAYALHIKRNNFITAQMDCCALAISAASPDSALYYYNEALTLSKRTNIAPLHKIFIGMGYTYLQLKQYDKAAANLKTGLERAIQLGYTGDLPLTYQGLVAAYTGAHDYEQALKYQKAYADMRDSITNNANLAAANTLEIKYRTAEKDKEIAEGKLQVLGRDSKLQEKNKWILAIISGLFVLGVLFMSVVVNYKRREKLQTEKERTLKQQQEINDLRSVIAGEENERTRIARELHDGIMVQLAAIKMKLRNEKKMRTDNTTGDEILIQLDSTITELRQTAHNLMPDMLLEAGLTDALFYCCKSFPRGTDLNIIFQHYGELPHLLPETELYLYRIVQELLQNIIKHAHATKALVQMNYHPPFVSFSVEDNGIGYDKNITGEGMGLKSINSRLRALGGTIDIQSNKQQGTTIFFELNVTPFIRTKNETDADKSSYS